MPRHSAYYAEHHGVGQHTDVNRELWLPANEGFALAGTPSAQGWYGLVSGAANAAEPGVYFTTKVPDDFVSFVSVKAVWHCFAAAGNMYWVIMAYYGAAGESYVTHSDSPAFGITATGGDSKLNVHEPANPLTLASLAFGDILGLRFARDGSNLLDTLNAIMWFYGLLFTYKASQ